MLCNNVTSVSIFIGCWPWSIKGHSHKWRQIHVSRLVFLFSYPKNPSINQLNFYCIKQIDYIFRVCTVIDHMQKTSQRVKNNNHATRLRLVSYFFQFFDNQKWKIHVVIFVIWLCMYGGTAVYSRVPFISLGMVAILLLMVLNLP